MNESLRIENFLLNSAASSPNSTLYSKLASFQGITKRVEGVFEPVGFRRHFFFSHSFNHKLKRMHLFLKEEEKSIDFNFLFSLLLDSLLGIWFGYILSCHAEQAAFYFEKFQVKLSKIILVLCVFNCVLFDLFVAFYSVVSCRNDRLVNGMARRHEIEY